MAPSAESPATRTDLSGMTLGDFHLEKKLGQGGMGQVYLGEQVSLKRKVAVKVMRADVTSSATSLARFRSEAQAIARMVPHPNIVQVYTIAEHEGLPYIALEFVEGTSLGQYMSRKGALPVDLTLKILKQVAAALAHAGDAGIVHRDIKPENILITRKADAKVTDFGLARSTDENEGQVNLTQSGVIVGTPVYMSPEQVQGKKPDCRTDIYSLGVTAYHMLAGQPPFRGESAFDLALKHVQTEAEPLHELRPDVPADLAAIVKRMMAKNPDDRFANGRDLQRALNCVGLNGAATRHTEEVDIPLKLQPEEPPASPRRKTERHKSTLHLDRKGKKRSAAAMWIGVGVAALLLIPLSVIGGVKGYRALHAPDRLAQRPPEPPGPGPEPPPDRPPPPRGGDKADEREEERLKGALHKGPFDLAERLFMRQLDPYIDLGSYYLKTKQCDKAEAYFKELQTSNTPRPPVLLWLGELGTAIVLSHKDETARSNELFQKLFERPAPPNRPNPRALMHHPKLKPHVIEALDRNKSKGELPPELQRFRQHVGL